MKEGFCVQCCFWLFKSFCLALWLYNVLVVNDVAYCGGLGDSLGHGEHLYMVSKYLTVLLVDKTKFSNPCHALKSTKPFYIGILVSMG